MSCSVTITGPGAKGSFGSDAYVIKKPDRAGIDPETGALHIATEDGRLVTYAPHAFDKFVIRDIPKMAPEPELITDDQLAEESTVLVDDDGDVWAWTNQGWDPVLISGTWFGYADAARLPGAVLQHQKFEAWINIDRNLDISTNKINERKFA